MEEIQVDNGTMTAYLATPERGVGPGVLVLHAWWGLTDFFKNFCDRLAGEGFVVLAPDLYHGATAATIDQAEHLSSKLGRAQATKEVTAAADHLRSHPNVKGDRFAMVGFSLGAYWGSWLVENRPSDIAAAVLFYGKRPGDYSGTQASFLGHFAERDEFESLPSVRKVEKQMRAAGKQVTFHIYPGTGHWFFEADRPEEYHPAAAQLAWERTVAFLHAHLDLSSVSQPEREC